MKVRLTRQAALVVAHVMEPKAPRSWVFTCCAQGISKLLGYKLRRKESIDVELQARLVRQQEGRMGHGADAQQKVKEAKGKGLVTNPRSEFVLDTIYAKIETLESQGVDRGMLALAGILASALLAAADNIADGKK